MRFRPLIHRANTEDEAAELVDQYVNRLGIVATRDGAEVTVSPRKVPTARNKEYA